MNEYKLLRLDPVKCGAGKLCQGSKFKVYGLNDIDLCFVCDTCGSVYTIRSMKITGKNVSPLKEKKEVEEEK